MRVLNNGAAHLCLILIIGPNNSNEGYIFYLSVNIVYALFQFLYVNQSFAPSPDQIVRNLYDCYETDGKLILHYCKSQAWG